MGLTSDVGATLVVALDWTGTRSVPPFSDTPRDPKEPKLSANYIRTNLANFRKLHMITQMYRTCPYVEQGRTC